MELDHVRIRGAREHNLKSVDVRIPKKSLVVLTGVSGSGKSSLAFDTLYAEGQRRYVESLSAYARQFLGRLDKPRFDSMRGLSPTISIEQKTAGSNPRSTVGTITEISDYLRVLFARVGVQHCVECGEPVQGQSAQQIAQALSQLAPDTRVHLLVPLLVNRKGEHRELLADARREGIVRLRVDGEIRLSEELEALDKRRKHTVEAVLDRLVVGRASVSRITESVEKALERGQGELIAALDAGDRIYSSKRACCGRSYPELTPQAFSFNNPQGMCPDCSGLGTRVAMDPARIVPNPEKSIDQGAVVPWGEEISKKNSGWENGTRLQVLRQLGVPLDKPWHKLTAKQKDLVLWGTGEKRYAVRWEGQNSQGTLNMRWEGVIPRMMRRFAESKSERAKAYYQQFVGNAECPTCKGSRLRPESAAVRVSGQTLTGLGRMTVRDCRAFFDGLELAGSARLIAGEVLKEVQGRLGFLDRVGLGYLSLDRSGPTLSGGEAQRIRLASQVGSELTGVIYVLDEPSIGLHQRDNDRLIATLKQMRDIGNTVVVVEHDEDTILNADYVIDFGPGAGAEGGRVVHAGTPKSLLACKESLTGAYLSGTRRIEIPTERRKAKGYLTIRGATENNLKKVDVQFPLGVLTAVTGVSGAGKSTLVNDILFPALASKLHGASVQIGKHEKIQGLDAIDKVIDIDQKPIGRTPRSNPATYIKAFDEIRKLFAELPEARARGYSPGRFSFNVKGGRCETCEGDGVRKIEMHFLADVFVTCEECHGRRFNEATLEVKYKGKSIADVLELTVSEGVELFSAHSAIAAPLRLLEEVGVGYLHLGQPSPTLSGGEAQRIKLARELAKRETGDTLYLLDEPTTGLHFEDVRKLLGVLVRLVETGNTVVVIEHNLDVIKTADYVIDLGPEGGPDGGHLVCAGTPEEVAQHEASFTGRYLRSVLARERTGREKTAVKQAASKQTASKQAGPETGLRSSAQGRNRATSKATSSSRSGAKLRSSVST
jgi:excinuclease ABC subunit A